jgi:hypothetical protein
MAGRGSVAVFQTLNFHSGEKSIFVSTGYKHTTPFCLLLRCRAMKSDKYTFFQKTALLWLFGKIAPLRLGFHWI